MKHVVIDARSRPSSTGRYIDRLIEHLQKIDSHNNYTILLRPGDRWQPSASNFRALTCRYKQFTFNFFELFAFGRFISNLKPDVVHYGMSPQEPLFHSGKRVTTAHDLTMLRFVRAGKLPLWLHWIRMGGYRFLFWWSHRVADHIIVPTQFVADDLTNLRPWAKDKITVTYEASEPPLSVSSSKPSFMTKFHLPNSKFQFLLHVGSPLPHKNIERLMQAFEKLKTKHPNLMLVLPGKKEQYFEKFEESITSSKYRDSVIIPGFVSDAELKWLYENAEAYVLPSLSEGFGLPGLEAMAHGCPLVSSNATCMPEVYGEAAHYFDPLNVQEMADRVDEVISNQELRSELIQKGHSQLKKYSWKKMAQQTLDIYHRVLK